MCKGDNFMIPELSKKMIFFDISLLALKRKRQQNDVHINRLSPTMGCCHCAPHSLDVNIIVVPQNDFCAFTVSLNYVAVMVCCAFHTKIDNNVSCF